MKKVMMILALVLSSNAYASTAVEVVGELDAAREGNLQNIVLANYEAKLADKCDINELSRTDIIKVSSDSSNVEKVPGTPYTYSATYLVLQKCLSGSTFQGAYLSAKKSVLIEASFTSKYINGISAPEKMENLTIKVTKAVKL